MKNRLNFMISAWFGDIRVHMALLTHKCRNMLIFTVKRLFQQSEIHSYECYHIKPPGKAQFFNNR